jgi:hypothetical protein
MGLAAAGVLAAVPATPAQAPPGGPGALPTIPGIPGQETARFKVVVEGDASSYGDASGDGSPTGCHVVVNSVTVNEHVTYGRGKGVTMEFVRFKAGKRTIISLQRAGRIGDASFAVKGTISRTVNESALVSRAPDNPQGEPSCPSATEHPSTTPGCNASFPLSADMKLLYGSGKLKVQPTGTELIGGTTPVEECPASEIAPSLHALPDHSWPVPPKLPGESLSPKKIFGKSRSFKVSFEKRNIYKTEPWAVIQGTIGHKSAHHAVVRFTRVH